MSVDVLPLAPSLTCEDDGRHRLIHIMKTVDGASADLTFDLNEARELKAWLEHVLSMPPFNEPPAKLCTCPEWAVVHPSNAHVKSCPLATGTGRDLEG